MPSDGKSSHCLWQGELKKGYNSKTCTSLTYCACVFPSSSNETCMFH